MKGACPLLNYNLGFFRFFLSMFRTLQPVIFNTGAVLRLQSIACDFNQLHVNICFLYFQEGSYRDQDGCTLVL